MTEQLESNYLGDDYLNDKIEGDTSFLGFIYKIVSSSTEMLYIGSTELPLIQRLRIHINDFKNPNKNCSSQNILKFPNFKMVLIHTLICKNKKDLRKEELRIFLTYPRNLLVNIYRPFLTDEQREKNKIDAHIKNKEYREINKDKIKAMSKLHYEANKERLKQETKKYYQANKTILNIKNKQYREINKDKIQAREKIHYQQNKEVKKAYSKKYATENKSKLAKNKKEYRLRIRYENYILGILQSIL